MKQKFEKYESAEEEGEFDVLFKRGQELLGQDNQAARAIFSGMIQRWPESPSAWLLLGASHYALHQYESAIKCFKKVAAWMPEDELASRSLFLALWRAGCRDKAYEELERFVSVTGRYTDDYDLMLADLRGEIDEEEFDKGAEGIKQKKLRQRSEGPQTE